MLRIVACDSRRARTMPVRSPLSSVTPALSIATSVPVPMAMPTSAAASAGASLTPSPAMATTRPSALQRCDDRALLIGQHLGLDLVDAEPPRHRLRRRPVVAGQHDDADALGLAAPRAPPASSPSPDRRWRATPATLAVDGDEDRGRAVARAGRSACARKRSDVDAELARNFALPSATRLPSTVPSAPLPVGESKSVHLRESRCRAPCAARTIAAASGCSLARSTLAASRSTSVSVESRRRQRSRSPPACLRSACRSCRPPACRPSPCAPALRRS